MYVIENLKSEKVVWFFYEKELQKTNQEECRSKRYWGERAAVRQMDRLFNNWINNKVIV